MSDKIEQFMDTYRRSLEARLASQESATADIREKFGKIQGTLDTLKWGVWIGVALAGVLGSLVSILVL